MTRFLLALDALALAFLVGALAFFAFGLAPVAFAVLPERTMAGNLVNASMARLQGLEAVCLAWLMLGQGLRAVALAPRRSRLWAAGLAVLAAAWAASVYLIGPPMHALRQAHPVMDALAKDHPDRVAFGRLHGLSTGVAGLMMLVGGAMVLAQGAGAAGASGPQPATPAPGPDAPTRAAEAKRAEDQG